MKETTQDNIIFALGIIDVILSVWCWLHYSKFLGTILFIIGCLLIIGDAMKQSYKQAVKEGIYKDEIKKV